MKILLTGGSGFLGSALAQYWEKQGHEIFLLLREQSDLWRFGDQTKKFKTCNYKSDVDILNFVARSSPDVVVHTACSYGRKGESHIELIDSNIRLGMLILQSIESGRNSVNFINIGTALPPEVSFYALSKFHFKQLASSIAEKSLKKIIFTSVILQQVFGAFDDESKFVTSILHACQRNEKEIQLTSGHQLRDFIYLDDAVEALDMILRECEYGGILNEYQVGSGIEFTIREAARMIHKITKSKSELMFGSIPTRINEPRQCVADLSSMTAIGWHPKINLETGIMLTIQKEMRL